MMQPTPATPDRSVRRGSILPTSVVDWVLLALAVGLLAWGIWRVIQVGGSLYGFGAMALAFTILPYRLAGIIGGVAFIALGIRELVAFNNTLLAAVLAILGILAILERVRREPGGR